MVTAILILSYLTITLYSIFFLFYFGVLISYGIENKDPGFSILMGILLIIFCFIFMIISVITIKKVNKCKNDGKKSTSFLGIGIFNLLFVNIPVGILCLLLEDKHFKKEEIITEVYCQYCGNKILSNDIYCPKCGNKIRD